MSVKIIYTDDIPNGFGGYFKPPMFALFGLGHGVIKIKKKYKEDLGLLNHELKHYQQYKDDWFWGLKYRFSKNYRLKCELEAYAEQIKSYEYKYFSQCGWIINALTEKYNLGFDKSYITNKVLNIWERYKELKWGT